MALVSVAVVDRVAVVTLDDPKRRNALSKDLVHDLTITFDSLEANGEAGAVIITGAPPAFCSGADLSHLHESREMGLRLIYEGFLRVARSPLPTIAAVNGPAVGAGLNLALACDLRLAGRSARFDSRFLDLGIHPGGGHTWMLRAIGGPQMASAMVIFGDVLTGEQAAEVGLVWRCTDDDELIPEARRLAAQAAARPTTLLRRTAATIGAVADVDTQSAALELELVAQLWSMEQDDFKLP